MKDKPIRVLLIEDDADYAHLVRTLLAKVKGTLFSLEWRGCLSKGLELLTTKAIEVIILDLHLPDGEGLDTFVRVNAQAPDIPIIVLTGSDGDNESLAIKAVQAGAQDYLFKVQSGSDQLVRSIRYAIERKRAEKALRKAHEELERRVEERTAELSKLNELLRREITERKRAEETIKENLAQLSKKNRYEAIISAVTRSVHQSINLQDVLENAVEAMSKNIDGVDNVSTYLVEGQEAVMKAHRGYPNWFIKRLRRIPNPKGFVWETIIEGRPRYCGDVDKDTAIGLAERGLGTKSYLAMPVRFLDNVVGCININSFKTDAFSEEDLKLLEIVARQIETAINNAKKMEALRQSEERYRTLFDQSPVGVYIFDTQLKITQCNERMAEILQSSYDKIIGFDMRNLKDQSFNPAVKKALEGEYCQHESFYEATTSSAKLWLSVYFSPLRDKDGNVTGGMGVVEDITDRKRAEEQLLHNAFYDALTGLPNRALFMDRLGRLIERVKRHKGYLFAVLFLDLDRFKVVNDSLGHMVGDQLLVAIARRLEGCLRPGDTLARLGGDEFAILLDGIEDAGDTVRVSERIQKELTLHFDVGGQGVFTTASIGIALSSTGYDRPEEILRDADTAMYHAKALGRSRHEMFDTSMHTSAVALFHLEAELRQAIEREELVIHYQPIVSLISGKVTGVEVLLRWRHPQRGLISPKEFVPVAEETGLIAPIGEWALRAACKQNKAWQDMGLPPLYIAVNLSARQFQNQNLPELVKKVLKETGMPSQSLKLEITESIAMKNISFSVTTLKELSAEGIQISIDDFGTGYSSLGYLKSFPVSTLKIEQSFVKDISRDSDNTAAIITAIIAMAKSLKLNVTAEGVETEEQVVFLLSQGCDEIQGYIFSEPVSAEEITKLLEERRRLKIEPQVEQEFGWRVLKDF